MIIQCSSTPSRLDVNVRNREEAGTRLESVLVTLLGYLIDLSWFDMSHFGRERYGRPWNGATDSDRLSGFNMLVVHRYRKLYTMPRRAGMIGSLVVLKVVAFRSRARGGGCGCGCGCGQVSLPGLRKNAFETWRTT